jgi:hypothetical protein
MFTFHVENGTSMPLLFKLNEPHTPTVVHEVVVAASSPELRWNYGQNPAVHFQHPTSQLDVAVWSVTQPQAPPLLFTMDASKTNHLTLMCRQAFVEHCSPTTMIFVGKHLPAWNV